MSTKKLFVFIIIPLFLVCTLGFGAASTVKAVEFDHDGVVEAGEVIDDDLFIAGDVVRIDGTVNGDVFAAGSVVKINGTINGSLASGAQTILVTGKVNGSIYAGSSTLTLGEDAVVGRNLYYGGFNLTTDPGSYVSRDLLVGAYQALLSGEVARDVRAGVGALEIDGKIGNDVIAEVGGPSDTEQSYFFSSPPGVQTVVSSGLRVSPDAEIGGMLKYKSSEEQSKTIEIRPAGGISFEYDPRMDTKKDADEADRIGSTALILTWTLKQVRVFITLLLLGGLIAWQLPALLKKVSEKVEKESMPSLGWGMVTFLVVYLGAILVGGLILAGAIFFGVITLGELSKIILTAGFSSLALILTGFGLLVSYGSKLVVAYLVGRLLMRWLAPKYEEQAIWPMIIGVLLYTFLRAIPVFGFVIGVFVTLIGIGAMWLTYRDWKPAKKAEA
jgi:cytoskeletal protein CcmA (bactofilin family)